MTMPGREAAVCRNEGCTRLVIEPGEELCGTCRLEACLFHRERRWSEPAAASGELPLAPAIESSAR